MIRPETGHRLNQKNDDERDFKASPVLICTVALIFFTFAPVQSTPDLFSDTFSDAGNKAVVVCLFARILLRVQLSAFGEGKREVAIAVLGGENFGQNV